MAFAPAIAAAVPTWLGTAATVVGTAVSAYGMIQSSNAQASAAAYEAKTQERDAYVASQNAKSAMETSRIAAEDERREHRRVLSSIRAGYGSSGVDMAGSPLDVLEDTAMEQALDNKRTEYEGYAQGRSANMQAQSYREGATLSRRESRQSGTLGALGYLAGGVGTALSRTA